MAATKLLKFARDNAIALLALFVALGGTGYAAVMINGKQIEKGTIRGRALKNHTLTGKQINQAKLGKVGAAIHADSATSATTAATANDANALGGAPAADYLKSGCGPGRIDGYAQIIGYAASFPTTYTSSSTFIEDAFNCSGQPVEVRRKTTGIYVIKFPGSPGKIGFGNWAACASNGSIGCLVSPHLDVAVTQIVGGPDDGAFQVYVEQTANSARADATVDVLIP
jgi:hypothetical protein